MECKAKPGANLQSRKAPRRRRNRLSQPHGHRALHRDTGHSGGSGQVGQSHNWEPTAAPRPWHHPPWGPGHHWDLGTAQTGAMGPTAPCPLSLATSREFGVSQPLCPQCTSITGSDVLLTLWCCQQAQRPPGGTSGPGDAEGPDPGSPWRWGQSPAAALVPRQLRRARGGSALRREENPALILFQVQVSIQMPGDLIPNK